MYGSMTVYNIMQRMIYDERVGEKMICFTFNALRLSYIKWPVNVIFQLAFLVLS
jgi:hypothetical protein